MNTNTTHVVFGAGALGREVARQLVETGATIRLANRTGSVDVPGAETVAADLIDPASAISAARGADIIYFCAAPAYTDWTRAFMALQDGAIAAARQTGAVLVVAENLYGYGVAGELFETMPLTATTRKGGVRARMSHRLFEAHRGEEIRAVSGRASDFFGPGVKQSALGDRFWPELLGGRTINWFGNPEALHSFTYLPDYACALIALGARTEAWGRAWHVPSLPPMSIGAFTSKAAMIAGVADLKIRRTPRALLRVMSFINPAVGELIEMEYSFNRDFVIRHDDWNAAFDLSATHIEAAISETIDGWRAAQDTHCA
jgi:nucleoside-diphosphate-sugar epimerase